MAYICEGCRELITPDQAVVSAAQLVEVTNQGSTAPEYVEGVKGLWHEAHWNDPQGWRKLGDGPARDFVSFD